MTTKETSPLTEAEPRSLDELFSADPLSLSDRELDQIITSLRANRDKFAAEDAEASQKGRKRKPTAYKDPPPKGKISLGAIGLGGKLVFSPEDKK